MQAGFLKLTEAWNVSPQPPPALRTFKSINCVVLWFVIW